MDRIQFIANIVTNIVAAIIIWLAVRLTRGTIKLFKTGTVKTKVSKVFNAKRISILGSSLAALFNLWVLGKFVAGQSTFTRQDVAAALVLFFITVYWINRLIAESRSTVETQLASLQKDAERAKVRAEALALELEVQGVRTEVGFISTNTEMIRMAVDRLSEKVDAISEEVGDIRAEVESSDES